MREPRMPRWVMGGLLAVAAILIAAPGVVQDAVAQDAYGPAPLPKAGKPTAEKPTAEEKIPGIPKLRVRQSRYDWGEVYQGEVVTHTFTLENAGDGILKIEKVKPG